MGVETVIEASRSILEPFARIFSGSDPAKAAATAGLAILLFIAAVYAAYGLAKLGKLMWNLKIKRLTLGLTILGIALIVIAVLLP